MIGYKKGVTMVMYDIVVKTGFRFGGWTKDDVFIKLYGNGNDDQTNFRTINRNAFTRGTTHKFEYESNVDLGLEARIELWRNGYWFTSWYVDWIKITNRRTDNTSTFPVQKWIKQGHHYFFNHIDTCLPQLDRFQNMRIEELRNLQKEYQLEVKEAGLPAQVRMFFI